MELSTKRFDYVLSRADDNGALVEHGLMVDWSSQDTTPFQFVAQEQKPPDSVATQDADQLYTGRDLSDAWRMFFTSFTGGNGQLDRDAVDGTSAKFWDSESIDISKPGELKLLHQMEYLALDPGTLGGLVIEAEGKVVFSCHKDSPYVVGWLNDDGTFGYASGITDDNANVTALASDGEYVYAALTEVAQYGVWRGHVTETGTPPAYQNWEIWADNLSGIEALVYCGGYLYAIQDSEPGYLDLGHNFVPLDYDAIHTPHLSTFGFSSIGNWMYWGVTSGARSWVYTMQHNPEEGDQFLHYVELPTGFVGTTMHGYLGNLYIAGYFISNRGEMGQGAIYLAGESGVARLATIGQDPNALPLGDPALDDTYNNRVRVMQGYGSYLYVATDRALYRWDLQQGGLCHVSEVGPYGEGHGTPPEPGQQGTWDANHDLTPFPSNWTTIDWDERWGTRAFPNETSNFDSTLATFHYQRLSSGNLRCWSSTANKAGHNAWARLLSSPHPSVTDVTLELVTATITHQALEFGFSLGNKVAHIRVYGGIGNDSFQVGYWNGTAMVNSAWLPGRNSEHTFYFTCDSSTFNCWVDGVRLVDNVTMPVGSQPSYGIWWSPGWGMSTEASYHGYPNNYDADWELKLKSVRAKLDSSADPYYVPGVASIPGMAMINGAFYVPCVPGGADDDGLISWDVASYVPSGWLTTSWKSAQMPTVLKHFTAIDVFFEPLLTGQSLRVEYFIDGEITDNNGFFEISNADTTGWSYTYPLDVHGRRVRLRYTLNGPGSSSPVCRGACVRWAPSATKVYTMMTLFKDNVRDYDGADYNYLDAYDFILAAADSGAILNLRARGIDIQAKVTGFQFMKAKGSRAHTHEPQGVALVRLERVE